MKCNVKLSLFLNQETLLPNIFLPVCSYTKITPLLRVLAPIKKADRNLNCQTCTKKNAVMSTVII